MHGQPHKYSCRGVFLSLHSSFLPHPINSTSFSQFFILYAAKFVVLGRTDWIMNKVKYEKAYCVKMEGTHIRKLGLVIFAVVLLSGCSGNGFRIDNNSSEDHAKAEEVLINDKRLTSAVTVFHENDLTNRCYA